MWIIQKVRNVARGLAQRYAPKSLKKNLWDAEYASGRWDLLDHMPNDCVYAHIEAAAKGGSVLDLGCGPGTTGMELKPESYRRYTGVDISEVAVARARERSQEVRRGTKNEFVQSEILSFEPTQKYDVIVFGDSIYYIPRDRIVSMLERYASYLTARGVFIVRTHDSTGRYQDVLKMIEENFITIDKKVYAEGDVSVVSFCKTPTAAAAAR